MGLSVLGEPMTPTAKYTENATIGFALVLMTPLLLAVGLLGLIMAPFALLAWLVKKLI